MILSVGTPVACKSPGGWLRAGRAASDFYLLIVAAPLGVVALFGAWMRHTAAPGVLPRTAVMFTGQFGRLTAALDLLSEGKIARIFVSGVNAGAGIRSAAFVEQLKLPEALRQELAAGGIVLASDTNDTLENGCETAEWLAGSPNIASLVLDTSLFHMSDRGNQIGRILLDDFMKFVATLVPSLIPTAWADERPSICRAR